MLYFVFKMLSEGDITLPDDGMQAIPQQLASALPGGTVRLGTRVYAIRRSRDAVAGLALDNGEELQAVAVVVATDVSDAAALTGAAALPQARSVACVYLAAERPPVREPLLVLDGEARGPVVTLCVPSQVAPGYAPPGQHLVAATVIGLPNTTDAVLEHDVRAQMETWFGSRAVSQWRHLRTYRIPWAQFNQSPGALEPAERSVRRGPGLYVCGDHVENASINGALHAGRRAAEAVIADLAGAR